VKKIVLMFVCVALLLPLFSCGEESTDTTDQSEEIFRPVYDYDLSEYIKMGDTVGVRAKYKDDTTCTEEEIDEAIVQVMLSHAAFSLKEGSAELYNKIKIDFTLFLGEEELTDYAQSGYELVIGDRTGGDIEQLLGAQMIGAAVGEERSVAYTYPKTTDSGVLAGKTVTARGKVLEIYQHTIPECNDAFVQALEGFSFQTVAAFRESVKADILEERREEKLAAVWTAFCETVEVISYPEKELDFYYKDYQQYYQNMAENLEMELSEFVVEYLGIDTETYEENAKSYAQELVKNDMIFTQLSRVMGITLSQEEYESGVDQYFADEEESFSSREEFISYYTEEVIRQNLIWDKALSCLVEKAVRIEE